MNISAYTQNGTDYPGYVSLNQDADGAIFLTVRSPGDGGKNVGSLPLLPEALEALATDALMHLHGVDRAATAAMTGDKLADAVDLLSEVKVWRDAQRQGAFPHELRERIDALLALVAPTE